MKINRFEDIVAWQKAKQLNLATFETFRTCHDYYFKDQILRASLSIMNNIAEGYGRRGNKEFQHFLYISNGSCNEVKSMLYLALDFKHVDEKSFQHLFHLTEEIGRITNGLIGSIVGSSRSS